MTLEQMISLYGIEKVTKAAEFGIRFNGRLQAFKEQGNRQRFVRVTRLEAADAYHRVVMK